MGSSPSQGGFGPELDWVIEHGCLEVVSSWKCTFLLGFSARKAVDVSARAVKLELDAPFPLFLFGHLAIRCSVLSQIRHFMILPLRSRGFPRRPNPLPVVPFLFPLPFDERKA